MNLSMLVMAFVFYSFAGSTSTANLKNGVMLKGFDPVSYFKAPKPSQGKASITAVADGLTYQFSSEENKQEFLKNPKLYVPQYEGWCATAVADGYKYDIDPENFKITEGRLFLFYKGWKGDAKKSWVKDEPNQIKKADSLWPKVRSTEE